MQATELFPLDSLRERLSKAVRIHLNGDCTRQKLEALWDLLSANQGDRPVAIELEVDSPRQETSRQCRCDAADPRQTQQQQLLDAVGAALRRRVGHPAR